MCHAGAVVCSVRLVSVADDPCLIVEPPGPAVAISSASYGGGIGPCEWVINLHVSKHYDRDDPDRHLDEARQSLGLSPIGAALMTAAKVERFTTAAEHGIEVVATVGLSFPTWAADIGPRGATPIPHRDDADDPVEVVAAPRPPRPGTINLVAWVPERLSDAALVNAVATITEAKVQALGDAGIPGTGTATDAVVIMCPAEGDPEPYGGPRSRWGAPLARAVYRSVVEGAASW